MSHANDIWRTLAASAQEASRRGPGTIAERRGLFLAAANGAAVWREMLAQCVDDVRAIADAAGVCCGLGRVVQCVCVRSTDCERHGRRCEGGHG